MPDGGRAEYSRVDYAFIIEGGEMSATTPAWLLVLVLVVFGVKPACARDSLYIVGSSTVYPFAKLVVDRVGLHAGGLPAKIEATGSGGGFQLFCGGKGREHPDLTNASRQIKRSEYEMCLKNGVSRIVETKIGYDGIVLVTAKRPEPVHLSRRAIFLALAAKVPAADGSESVVSNPYRTWKDVDPSLPDQPIKVLGPPPTSGTRDAFAELAMEEGCQQFPWVSALKKKNKVLYQEICHGVRQDGAYVDAGEDDKLIVRQVSQHPDTIGIFGFSFLVQNDDIIDGVVLEGVTPTFENISSGVYPLSRPLFFYVNAAHVGLVPGIEEYLHEFTAEATWGPGGYLAAKGLIPMPEQERRQYRQRTRELTVIDLR